MKPRARNPRREDEFVDVPAASQCDRTLVTALREHLRATTGQAVPLIETHISWVLLTDRLAYKLKKPVHLPFVDFSTLAARKHFCEEELRLNRRLAPSIYLEVVPVCGTPEAPHLGGDDAIDFAVCMQRFPEEAVLRNLLSAGRLRTNHLLRFAERLAVFHREATVTATCSDFGTPEQVLARINDALAAQGDVYDADRLQPLHNWLAQRGTALRAA